MTTNTNQRLHWPKTPILALGLTVLSALAFLGSNNTYAENANNCQTNLNGVKSCVCKDQAYALCASARCVTLDGVAYCKCDIEHGNSASRAYQIETGKTICDLNKRGRSNGYMVSTFSLPAGFKEGKTATYVCPPDTVTAQCDGGICFTSSIGNSLFPKLLGPLTYQEILCSCPPDKSTSPVWVDGPFPCKKTYWEEFCVQKQGTKTSTGIMIKVGASPITTSEMLEQLYGEEEFLEVMKNMKFCGRNGEISRKQALGNISD